MAKRRLRLEQAHGAPNSQLDRALQILQRAHDCAAVAKKNVWEFAVSLVELIAEGIDPSHLRQLVADGLVQHGLDHTTPNEVQRTIRRVPNLSFTDRSNFVLSDQGVAAAVARTAARKSVSASPPSRRRVHSPRMGSRTGRVRHKGLPILTLTGRRRKKRYLVELDRAECWLPAGQFRALCKLSAAQFAYQIGGVRLPRATVSRLRHALAKVAESADDLIELIGKDNYVLTLGPQQIAVHPSFCRLTLIEYLDRTITTRLLDYTRKGQMQ